MCRADWDSLLVLQSKVEIHAGEDVQRANAVFAGKFLKRVENRIGVSPLVEQVACREADFYAVLETIGKGSIQ